MGGYPDGVAEADPAAPWNAPDPWEGRECGECAFCDACEMLDGSARAVCGWDGLMEVRRGDPACEAFEESEL